MDVRPCLTVHSLPARTEANAEVSTDLRIRGTARAHAPHGDNVFVRQFCMRVNFSPWQSVGEPSGRTTFPRECASFGNHVAEVGPSCCQPQMAASFVGDAFDFIRPGVVIPDARRVVAGVSHHVDRRDGSDRLSTSQAPRYMRGFEVVPSKTNDAVAVLVASADRPTISRLGDARPEPSSHVIGASEIVVSATERRSRPSDALAAPTGAQRSAIIGLHRDHTSVSSPGRLNTVRGRSNYTPYQIGGAV